MNKNTKNLLKVPKKVHVNTTLIKADRTILGQCHLGQARIDVDIRQTGHEMMDTLVHEVLHEAFKAKGEKIDTVNGLVAIRDVAALITRTLREYGYVHTNEAIKVGGS